MLIWLRAGRSWVAAALLLCLATATVSQALPAHADDDHHVECTNPSVGPHDESAHRLNGARTPHEPHPLHCLVCHWARTFRPLGPSVSHEAPRLEIRAALHFTELPAPAVILPAQLTLRSPPRATSAS